MSTQSTFYIWGSIVCSRALQLKEPRIKPLTLLSAHHPLYLLSRSCPYEEHEETDTPADNKTILEFGIWDNSRPVQVTVSISYFSRTPLLRVHPKCCRNLFWMPACCPCFFRMYSVFTKYSWRGAKACWSAWAALAFSRQVFSRTEKTLREY